MFNKIKFGFLFGLGPYFRSEGGDIHNIGPGRGGPGGEVCGAVRQTVCCRHTYKHFRSSGLGIREQVRESVLQ